MVCLVGASYVTTLTGGGRRGPGRHRGRAAGPGPALALGGVRVGVAAQLGLVAVLVSVIVLAVGGSAAHARAASWTPFAPHGWGAIGPGRRTLMLSFVGWEAVAPLTARFADPRRQLPRVIAHRVHGHRGDLSRPGRRDGLRARPGAGTDVPLARLLAIGLGPAGHAVAAVAAVVLTLGSTNAYLSGAAAMARTCPLGVRRARRRLAARCW